MQSRNKRITYAALLIALGIIFGYIEFLFPLPVGIPGVKLGLSNVITVVCLYLFDPIMALGVLIIRVVLSGMLFGNFFGILYSLAGALVSWFAMTSLKKFDVFSVIGVSVAGGVSHNIGQLIVACLVVSQLKIMFYLPVLLVSGVICGFIVGIVSRIINGTFINRLI